MRLSPPTPQPSKHTGVAADSASPTGKRATPIDMVADPYPGPRPRPARQLEPQEQSTIAEVIYVDSSSYNNNSQPQEMGEVRARPVHDRAGGTSADLARINGDFIDSPPRPRQPGSPPKHAWGVDTGSPQRQQEGNCATGGHGSILVPDAMRKKGGASPSSVMGPMLAMEGGAAKHGGVTSLTDEKRSSAFAPTPAKVAARQAHLSSAAGQDSHTHNASISRPASRPKHNAKEGGVGEVVFGLNPDGCSTDTAQEETFGLGGAGLSAGLSSKAQQARAAYLFTRLSIPYP
jgi:hypothetical protein